MDEQIKEAKNENIRALMARKPNKIAELEIFVAPKAVNAAFSKAIKEISKRVSLPGFRKGKAPEDYIKENFSEQVNLEWRQLIANIACNEAINLLRVQPLNPKEIRCTHFGSLEKDKELNLKFEFEESIILPTIDLESIQLEIPPLAELNDEMIDESIDSIRYKFSKWNEITGRSIQEGDFVELSMDRLDGEKQEEGQVNLFHIHPKRMPQWLKKVLIGANIGDVLEATTEKEETLENLEENSEEHTPVKFKIAIKSIKEPSFQDESIYKMLGCEDMQGLRSFVTMQAEMRLHQEQLQLMHEQLDQWIVKNYSYELPQSLVKGEIEARLEMVQGKMREEGLTEEEIKTRLPEVEAQMKEVVVNQMICYFLYSSLAEKFRLKPTKSEIEARISEKMKYENLSLDQLQKSKQAIERGVMVQKVRDFLLSNYLAKQSVDKDLL